MSHEIEIVDGVAQMAYAGVEPWHGLGTRVSNDLTPNQMLKAAGLDWKVQKVKMFADRENKTKRIPIVGQQALIRNRDDAVLTIVGKGWNPVQNDEAFEFFNDFVGAGEMEMHTAGSLKGGKIVWALAKVKESFELFDGRDRVDSYLLFSNPHEFGRSIDVRFSPIRVVCNNTLTMALDGASKSMAKVSHKRKFNADEVKAILGVSTQKLTAYKAAAEFIASKRYTPEAMIEYFQTVFPKVNGNTDGLSRNGEVAKGVVDTQPGAEYGAGSFWQLFNAATYAIDHKLCETADTRLTSAWYGPNANKKLLAMDTAIKMAEAA